MHCSPELSGDLTHGHSESSNCGRPVSSTMVYPSFDIRLELYKYDVCSGCGDSPKSTVTAFAVCEAVQNVFRAIVAVKRLKRCIKKKNKKTRPLIPSQYPVGFHL